MKIGVPCVQLRLDITSGIWEFGGGRYIAFFSKKRDRCRYKTFLLYNLGGTTLYFFMSRDSHNGIKASHFNS